MPAVRQGHVFDEAPGADAHERDSVAVTRVHVRLNLEHKTGEPIVRRVHGTCVAHSGLWTRRNVDECLQEGLESEVGERTAEEHRSLTPFTVLGQIE